MYSQPKDALLLLINSTVCNVLYYVLDYTNDYGMFYSTAAVRQAICVAVKIKSSAYTVSLNNLVSSKILEETNKRGAYKLNNKTLKEWRPKTKRY